jgi:hypothetical protein
MSRETWSVPPDCCTSADRTDASGKLRSRIRYGGKSRKAGGFRPSRE